MERKERFLYALLGGEKYVEAVARAATDLGRREARLQILEARLENALKKVSKSTATTKKS